MAFRLDSVVPWGRSFDEYRAMFGLSSADLDRRILGCADGPASFCAELVGRGGRAVAVDPLYRHNAGFLRRRCEEVYEPMLAETRRHRDEFVWRRFPSVAALGAARRAAMERFLEDYELGRRAGRYLAAALPRLPLRDHSFELALCSHYLFLYSEQIDEQTHLSSLLEMLRVAKEIRVFPLLELGSLTSRHLPAILTRLARRGYLASVEEVDYELQRGGNRQLRVVAT